jgi:1,5-anhydro-D-fructose reductase (1,5-anhydro-D-mannitol-forming)
VSDNGKIRWGLLGASNIAKEWLTAAIRSHPDCEVISVFTSSEERGKQYVEALNLKRYYTDLEAFLGDPDIDAVYISTTNDRHRNEVLAAARAGKHVLCEKPLALSVSDANDMVEAAQSAGIVFATNHHIRNMETHRAIKQILKSGEIGQVTSARVSFTVDLPENLARWRMYDQKRGAGVILDLTVHDLDTLRYYFDASPVRVSGIGCTTGDAPEGIIDNVATVWEFPGRVVVICQDSFLVPHGGTAVEIHGSAGSIVGKQVLWQEPQGEVIVSTADGTRCITVEHRVPYKRTIADFVAAIRGEGSPSASGGDGVESLRLALAAQEAIDTGKTVEL